MEPKVYRVGRVRIPLAAIVGAVPEAYRDARKTGADDRDPDSPGGVQVTPGEVLEAIGVFFATLSAEAAADILRANGCEVPTELG